MDYRFQPPPKEFAKVAVDQKMMASLFNPEATTKELKSLIKKRRTRRGGTRRRAASRKKARANSDENLNVQELDMSSGAGSDHILTDEEIEDVILTNFGSLRKCVLAELASNPKFRGVQVEFFVRPSGTTGGVKIKEKKLRKRPVAACLAGEFRNMKFPKHGGLNRGVTYPLMVGY